MKRASITKRPYTYKGKTEDRWRVLWTDPKGKRREKSFHNKRHAQDHATKIDRDIDRGIHETGSGKITFGEAWKAWIAHCEHRRRIGDLAGNTLANREWGADHILPEFGQRQIGKITSGDVEEWALTKRETLADSTVKNFYGFISYVLDYAVRKKKWLASNPLRDDPIRIGGEKKRPYIPSFEDVELLIQILHGPRPAWCHTITWENRKIAFALETFAGLRVGEVAALRWDAIDLPGTTFRVDEKAGTASMYDELKKPKSKAGIRTVPISQYLYDALLEHAHATDMKGFVIKNQNTADRYLSSNKITEAHHDLMVRAGLTKPDGNVKFSTHKLRHWYVSALSAIGLNVVAIAKRLGHADPSITMSIYAHVIEGTEDGTRDAVAPIWHQRLTRAEPGRATMIEGVASETGPLIEGEATHLIETVIPQNAYPWVPEALRLLEGGWRVSDVSRHLGLHRASLHKAFHRLGLSPPVNIRRKVRNRRFEELRDAGYTDLQIAQKLNCSHVTVLKWRLTNEEGVPNTEAEAYRLMKGKRGDGKQLTDEQVHEVWDRLEAGEPYSAIAKQFSVKIAVICNIKAGKNYRWVKQEREENKGASDPDKSLNHIEKRPEPSVASTEEMRESQLKLL